MPVKYDVDEWLAKNARFFEPPICNKLMYKDGQLKCFFVGGPNSRKDFHMEEGEEFFYMLKGDMNLIVVEQGKFKDVIIKEGEVFLLPGRIPHSPQRLPDTTGLVIERERKPYEMDCLRYYIKDSTEILYERWFHCDSLDSQLPPIIREFFSSEQHKTGKPLPGTILDEKPVKQDFHKSLDPPFSLSKWLIENEKEIRDKGKKALFDDSDFVSRVYILGNGDHCEDFDKPETFLWQMKGSAIVETENQTYDLLCNQCILFEEGESWTLKNDTDGVTLSVVMNPQPKS